MQQFFCMYNYCQYYNTTLMFHGTQIYYVRPNITNNSTNFNVFDICQIAWKNYNPLCVYFLLDTRRKIYCCVNDFFARNNACHNHTNLSSDIAYQWTAVENSVIDDCWKCMLVSFQIYSAYSHTMSYMDLFANKLSQNN